MVSQVLSVVLMAAGRGLAFCRLAEELSPPQTLGVEHI